MYMPCLTFRCRRVCDPVLQSPRPWRRLAVYASEHVMALLVLQEDTLQRAETQPDTPTTPTEAEASPPIGARPCIDPHVLANLCVEVGLLVVS